jgi:hypothetical protein
VNTRSSDGRFPAWLPCVAALLFLLYAANFLYFFVDDEAIPYVYAQNLLRGQGLTYNPIEPRVEGYSDFLHVWTSTLILALVRAADFPKITVFFVGKVLSLASGVAIVMLVSAVLRRQSVGAAGGAAGLAVVALTGPLALWSCSSLETVPFALAVTALAWALAAERDRAATVLAAVVMLERIDGFVFAGALIGAFASAATRQRRREMARRIVLPFAGMFVVYHACRIFYFGDLLPAPPSGQHRRQEPGGSLFDPVHWHVRLAGCSSFRGDGDSCVPSRWSGPRAGNGRHDSAAVRIHRRRLDVWLSVLRACLTAYRHRCSLFPGRAGS